ncbi:MAG: hypothetical protein ABJM43_13980 [Paracoccaceae bacterium]
MTTVLSALAGHQPLDGHPNGPGFAGPDIYGVISFPQVEHVSGMTVVFY